jgi:hypothetical protein
MDIKISGKYLGPAMKQIVFAILLLTALVPAAYANKADEQTLATSCAGLPDRAAVDCQEMMTYLREVAQASRSASYTGPKLGDMVECAAVVTAPVLEEASLRRCMWMAYAGREVSNMLERRVFKQGYPGFGATLSGEENCEDTLGFLERLGGYGIRGTKSTLAVNEMNCLAIVRMAANWGAEPSWAKCVVNTDPLTALFDCNPGDGHGDNFRGMWGSSVRACKDGRGPQDTIWLIKHQANANGRPFDEIDCDYIFDVAAIGGLMTEQEAADAKHNLVDFMVEVDAAQAAQEENRRQQAALEASNNPDTYGKLIAPGQPSSLLRNIEVGRDYHAVSGGNALFTSGLVDALIGNCPIALNPTQRAVLVSFIANATMEGRNAFGGNFDQIAGNVSSSVSIIREGHQAATLLRCEEPVSSKLVYNVLRLLGHG